MTKSEKTAVKKTIRSLYRDLHGCALSKRDIKAEDKARGLKVWQLCDDCESMINAHMQDLEQA